MVQNFLMRNIIIKPVYYIKAGCWLVGWLIWGLTSHQQRSYGDGIYTIISVVRQTGEARYRACDLWKAGCKGYTFQRHAM